MRRKGTSLVALVALLASGITFLETPPSADAAIVTNNLVLNLDASNTSSLAATAPTGWNSVSPATSTATSSFFGNPSRISDSTGTSLAFDGSSDAAVFPTQTAQTPGAMTVDMWVNPGNLRVGWNILASRWFANTVRTGGGSDWHFGIYGTSASTMKLRLDTASNNPSGGLNSTLAFPTISANKWYHVGFTIDPSQNNTATLWINGSADASATGTTHTDNSTAQLHVGDVGADTAFTGKISRFRIYNAALTGAQIAQNYLTDSARYGYAPANTVAPTISGTAKVGSAISTTGGIWGVGDAEGTTTAYKWQTSTTSDGSTGWTDISGATSASYTPVAADATNYLRVVVTKTNTAGSATATSSATLRVQASSGTALLSGGKLTGLTTTVPNDANTYNVTLATNNLSARMVLGTTTGLTLISGYASTAAYMATTIGGSAPIISFRGTGTAINTALANVTYTSSTQQVDVVKLYYASAGSGTETKDYIPIYDNNQLTFHYYAYKWHASGKNRADMDASVAPLTTTDSVEASGPWYLSTPRYQVEWQRIKTIVGQNSAYMGALADAGSANWYWPANTDGYSSATIFGTQSGTTVTATSNIYNQTNTTLPYHAGEPNGGTSSGRSGFFYIVNSQLGWDDVPLTITNISSFTMETFATAPFAVTSGSSGVLAQTVSVVANAFDAPTGLTVEASGTTGLAAVWNPVTPNITGLTLGGYRLEYSTSSSFSPLSVVITQPTVTSGIISGLSANTTYYVRVLAAGTSWGAYSPAVTVTTKSAATTISVVSSGGGVAGTDYTLSGGQFFAKSSNSVSINASDIQTALTSGNAVIAADNVIIDAPITWSTSRYLTLGNSTTSAVTINKKITSSMNGSQLVISTSNYNLDVKNGASIQFTSAGTQYLNIGGVSHTLIKTEAQLVAAAAGTKYALAKPITLTTSYTASPINLSFTGTLDGLGNTIDAMKISATTTERIGLINTLATGGVVRNLGVTNADISLSSSNYRVGVIAGGSTGGTIDQVWSTGFIRTTTTNSWLALGGLVGNAESGTLNISKSWSSVNIDSSTSGSTTALEQGGIIGGNELAVGQIYTSSGGSINLSQVFAAGTLKWGSAGHRGIGGLMGLHYANATTTISDAFSWVTFASGVPANNRGGIIGVAAGGSSAANRTYQTTFSECVAGGGVSFTATPNCDTKRTPGETVAGISGANWSATGPSTLINLPSPAKPLYVQVVAPSDGSYGTLSYQIVDGSGAVQNTAALSALNLSVSGTPIYKTGGTVLNSASAKATYSTYYDSGLALSGSSASYYSLSPWRENTSVTISKLAQTVSWTPTLSVGFGSGTFTPSPAPVASGGTTITYSVSSAGTTGCTINTSTGAITYTQGGSCAVTATAASAGDWLIASDTETFVIGEPATAPTNLAASTAGNGMLNIGWTAPTVSSSAAITGYTLTYSTNSGMTSPTTVNVGNTTGYLLTGLTAGTVYYFQVRAVSGSTWTGPLSAIASATPNTTATTINIVATGGGIAGTDYKVNGGIISTTGTANINASAIAALLATEGTVQLAATNVNVNSAISWSANSNLILGNTSAATVNVNSTVAGSGATAGVKILPATYGLSVKDGAYIRLTGATPSINVGGTSYVVVNTVAGLSNVLAGSTWALTAPITLSTTYTSAVKDFTFTGIMDGLGNTVNNMTINVTATKDAGFYAALGGSTVRNVGFTNVNISSPTDAINTRLGSVAGNGSITASATNTVSQVWATGFLNQTSGGTAKTEAGGLFGGAQTGTLNISKSWSSVAISTKAYSVGSGGIIGTNVGSFSGGTYSGSALTITESYSTGNILRNLPASPLWYGNAGIIGVSYGASTTLSNVFSWGNINSTGGGAGTSTAGISGVGAATVTNAYTTHSACGGTVTNCLVSQTAGSPVTGGTGFTSGLWQTVNGTSLTNLAPPTKALYVQVVAPTNGSYGTMSYQIVDSTGTVQDATKLTSINVSVTGTPSYTINSSTAKGTYSVAYVSGLTLGGASAAVYSLGAWITNTSVTISKLAQSISYTSTAPTTAKVNTTYTPAATSTSGGSVTFTIDSSTSSICSIAAGVVTFNALGSCVINANQTGSTDYLAAAQVQQTAIATVKGDQTVTYTTLAPTAAKVAGTTYTPTAASTSGGTVTFTIDEAAISVCSMTAGVVSFTAAGTCILDGDQTGNANWSSAPQVSQTFTVAKGDQNISFSSTASSPVVGGATYTPTATKTGGTSNAITFSIDVASSGVCSIFNGAVSFLTVGTCKVNANVAGDDNYNAATQAQQSFTVAKGAQTISFASNAPSTAKVGGNTYTVVANAGPSTGAVTLSVDASTSSKCSVSGLVVTYIAAGDCVLNLNQAGDSNYNAAEQTSQRVTVAKGTPIISFTSTPPTDAKVNGSVYVPEALTSGSGNVTFGIHASSSAICSISGGTVSFIGVGNCRIDANVASSNDWEAAATVSQTFAVTTSIQTIAFSSAAPTNARFGGSGYTPVLSDGSGSAPIILSVDSSSSSICSITNGVVSYTGVGICTLNINKAADETFDEAPQVQQSFEVFKALQTVSFTSTAPTSAVVSGTSYTPTAVGGLSGQDVTFAIDSTSRSICFYADGAINFTSPGDCVVVASQDGNNHYESASATQTFAVGKGAQTVAFTTVAPTIAYVAGSGYSPAAIGGLSGNAVVVSIDAESSMVCEINNGRISFIAAGSCVVLANQAGSSSYNAAPEVSQTITVNRTSQVISFVSSAPTNAKVGGATYQPIVVGGASQNDVTLSVASSSIAICSISDGVVSFHAVGDCVIDANQDGDVRFSVAAQLSQTVTVAKGAQSLFYTSEPPFNAQVQGTTYRPTATGGASGSAVVFSIAPSASSLCSIAEGTITFHAVGNCVLYADQAGNANYEAAARIVQTFDITKGQQTIEFTSTIPVSPVVAGANYQVSANGGSGTKPVTFAIATASASVCSITSAGLVSFQAAGTCEVVANQQGDSNFNAANPVVQSITVGKGSQSLVFASSYNLAQVGGSNYTPIITAGPSISPVRLTLAPSSSSVCELVAGSVTFFGAGNCVLQANQSGDSNYLSASQVTQTLVVAKGVQASISVSTSTNSMTLNGPRPVAVVSASGGTGTGAITWSVTSGSAANCSVSGNVVTALAVGFCEVVATKAADANYLVATRTITLSVSDGGQSPVLTFAEDSSPTFAEDLEFSVSLIGGTGSGNVWFESQTPSVCTITAEGWVSVLTAGTCIAVGHKDGDVDFSAAQDTLEIQVAKAEQTNVEMTIAQPLIYSPAGPVSSPITITGVLTSATPSMTIVSGSCTISDSRLVAISAGDCLVELSAETDNKYLAKTIQRTFTVAKANQATLVTRLLTENGATSVIAWNGLNTTQYSLTGGSGSGAKSLSSSTPDVCTATINSEIVTITGLRAGQCTVEITQAADSNYLVRTAVLNTVVLDLPAAPQAVTIENTGIRTSDGIKLFVNWVPSSITPSQAAVTGYEVQYKSGANWIRVDGGLVSSDSRSLPIYVTPWTSMFIRVAPVTDIDARSDADRHWTNFNSTGLAEPTAFNVPGVVQSISTSVAATATGEEIILTGSGFEYLDADAQIEMTAEVPVFTAGIRTASVPLTQTVLLPLRVISGTKLAFTAPNVVLPSDNSALSTRIRIMSSRGVVSDPVELSLVTNKLSQRLRISGLASRNQTVYLGSGKLSGKIGSAFGKVIATASPSSVCTLQRNGSKFSISTLKVGTCKVTIRAQSTPGHLVSPTYVYRYLVKAKTTSEFAKVTAAKTWSYRSLNLTLPNFTSQLRINPEDILIFDAQKSILKVKSRSAYVGTWSVSFQSPRASQKWFRVSGEDSQGAKRFVDSNICTTQLEVKAGLLTLARVDRMIGAGCQLSKSGKAALKSVGYKALQITYKRVPTYSNTGLDHIRVGGKITKVLKKTNWSVKLTVGKPKPKGITPTQWCQVVSMLRLAQLCSPRLPHL